MERHLRLLRPRATARLSRLVTKRFTDPARASELLEEFLGYRVYQRSYTLKLIQVAGGKEGDEWDTRRLATLMLENHLLKIPTADMGEWDFVLVQLKLKSTPGRQIHESVLQEGYSRTDQRGFVLQLRRRLRRLNRVHDEIKGWRSSRAALTDFVGLSRRDCKLTLARYLFRPEEVVTRILSQVRLSRGLPDLDPFQPYFIEEEAERTIASLPDFEARILRSLCRSGRIYWVSDATGSEINSLVECPLTTVVLVIKPPGSDVEFEIKRAGRRGRNPLGIVFRRNGGPVPVAHRLDGGSRQSMLRWEAEMSAKFSRLFRLVHEAEAPVPKVMCRSFIYNVPVGNREERLLNYFTDERIFGEGFRAMRAAMEESVESFEASEKKLRADLPGELGLTIRFLSHANPTQAVLSGTSSFRLDKLAAYLSDKGPEVYFEEGLRAGRSNPEARRFADEILEEILCVYKPPAVPYRTHKQYLKAAFSSPENRARADQNYLSVMRESGTVRGTLLALRGHSIGESFVARNVGLRTCWERGEWRIRIIFMDHDNLNVINPAYKDLQSLGVLSSMEADDIFFRGAWLKDRRLRGSVDCLNDIYRVRAETVAEGEEVFNRAAKAAYDRTLRRVEAVPQIQRFFNRSYVSRLRDWDTVAAEYLRARSDPEQVALWRERMRDMLAAKGYGASSITDHLNAVEAHGDFLERYSFLY
ncbi:MAG TPA: hypothetical protein VE262_20400 [Blastocatellia bacterium]|nr:hypothetical protein [Blastocatellia bacterium]